MPSQKLLREPIKHKSKNKLKFLSLAGELRNQIYAYHYNTVRVIELLKAQTSYQIFSPCPTSTPESIRCGKKLGKHNRVEGMRTRWDHSISGLHVANKQIHQECISLLYGSIAVFAQSSQLLTNFLEVVTQPNLNAITRLQLDRQTYGSPTYSKDNIWKTKEEDRWEYSCKLAASSLPNLHDLRINIEIRDKPLRFLLSEAWVRPFLHFKKLKHLENVAVTLYSSESMHTKVNVNDGNMWQHHPPWYVRLLVQQNYAIEDMHYLFGTAIAMIILGYCKDCALEEYEKAVRGKYGLWDHPSIAAVARHEVTKNKKHEKGECLAVRRSLMEAGEAAVSLEPKEGRLA